METEAATGTAILKLARMMKETVIAMMLINALHHRSMTVSAKKPVMYQPTARKMLTIVGAPQDAMTLSD